MQNYAITQSLLVSYEVVHVSFCQRMGGKSKKPKEIALKMAWGFTMKILTLHSCEDENNRMWKGLRC